MPGDPLAPDDDRRPGALRRASFRVARVERFPIPPTERLTDTEKASAKLSLLRGVH